MPTGNLNDKSIFNVARKFDSEGDRRKYLQRVCRENVAQLDRVTALLDGFEKDSQFLESPAADLQQTSVATRGIEIRGTQIGPYTIREQLGEGGMGVVYVAEQFEPVCRKVALKLIKPGMGTKDVIARFEAERQALARMNHPHIAKVLDAGATEFGRPYFVMELIKGVPITHYCDEKHLTPKERLELFVPVCQAVQHAHQKGVIHRDIKPSKYPLTCYQT